MRYALMSALLFSLAQLAPAQTTDYLGARLRSSQDSLLQEVLRQPLQYQLQLICTRIEPGAKPSEPRASRHQFGLDTKLYFYPAEAVALPAALLALEYLQRLSVAGLDRHSPLYASGERPWRNPSLPVAPTIAATIEGALQQQPESYNRLFNFLGAPFFNEQMQRKGYRNTRFLHWLGKAKGQRYTPPVSLYQNDSLLYFRGRTKRRFSSELKLKEQVRGVARINKGGDREAAPFDFRRHNFLGLPELHRMMQALFFPATVPSHARFALKEEDRQFLQDQLRRPGYRPSFSTPLSSAPLLYRLRGTGLGFLTESILVQMPDTGEALLLTLSLQVNRNQVFGDGRYEYDAVGDAVVVEVLRLLLGN